MRLENSFIIFPGIGEKTEKKLWKNGIRRWSQAEDSSLSRRKKEKILELREKARKNLEVSNTVFFNQKLPGGETWRMYENFSEGTAFFDIETTGLDADRNEVTTASFYRNGETTTLVKGQDLTRKRLEEEFFRSDTIVSFNGKRFDQPFLEKSFNLDIEKPHIDLMYLCRKLGIEGGLKQVEKKLEIDRELEDIDGREAIRLWKKYSEENDEKALEKLVRYNRYDTVNLEKLLQKLHKRLKQERFLKYLEG